MKYLVELNGRRVEVELVGGAVLVDGERLDASLREVPGTPMHLLALGDEIHAAVARRTGGRGRYSISVGGWKFDVEALDERRRAIQDMAREAAAAAGPVPLVAPMPGMIVRVNVEVGAIVEAGQGLVVMEAMKMENELRATSPGTVARVLVQAGQAVEKGSALVEFEG
jgi:acetyl/propionyl-CoA carboxylase alpha subunit